MASTTTVSAVEAGFWFPLTLMVSVCDPADSPVVLYSTCWNSLPAAA